MLDLEGAREMIDMLDALREKTMGNLAPGEDTLVLDILGNLKLAFMEMDQGCGGSRHAAGKSEIQALRDLTHRKTKIKAHG